MAPEPKASLVELLRQRKLAQWSLAYLAGAWALLQAVDLAAGAFAWPPLVLRAAWVVLPAGFLVVLVLAWYHGERGQQRVTTVEILMLSTLLAIAGAAFTLVSARGDEAEGAVTSGTPTASDVVDEASVVVLPFADLSQNRDQEYFADGLTEEILNALVRIPELRVPARTTSFSFKGKNIPVTDIARQLRVAHVLEGSVRKDADRLRITAQLIDARDDRHLWSEQYDREVADVFAVQEEIAEAVTGALKIRLGNRTGATGAGLVARGTADPEAYELYLRGLHAWNHRTAQSLQQAVVHYQRAVDRDPNFARAWAGLALTYALLPEYLDTIAAAWTPRVYDAAQRALALDPQLAEAHTARAYAYTLDWNRAAADREFRRALEINPSFPTAHQWYGSTLNGMGRSAEALQHMERARALDPLSFIIVANLADQFYYDRQFERAIARYDEAIALNPDALGGGYIAQRAIALLFVGREQEALEQAEALLARVAEDATMARTQAIYVVARSKPAEARTLYRALEERARRRYVSPTQRAIALVSLREHERAIELLHEAERTRDPALVYYLTNDPVFDPLRSDPRFQRLLERFRAGVGTGG